MKKILLILFFAILLLPSCRKSNDVNTSGTATLNNVLYLDPKLQTYYTYGFLFSSGSLVSILETPPPDITIDNDGTLGDLILQDNNLNDSFFKAGQYADATSAKKAFDALVSPVVQQWIVWADSLKPNQVWLFKTGSEHYAKLRIVSTVSEVRNNTNYAECTFEWVYQPDGTLSFPNK